ncbi:uncharacterized protein LOC142324545 [Lycorma delicatula]|uniref:uncharacterized protein LOC142324545 n=1 Tax=Lycorma delicatula TaxID=130591 RepID=UPI003F5199D9
MTSFYGILLGIFLAYIYCQVVFSSPSQSFREKRESDAMESQVKPSVITGPGGANPYGDLLNTFLRPLQYLTEFFQKVIQYISQIGHNIVTGINNKFTSNIPM